MSRPDEEYEIEKQRERERERESTWEREREIERKREREKERESAHMNGACHSQINDTYYVTYPARCNEGLCRMRHSHLNGVGVCHSHMNETWHSHMHKVCHSPMKEACHDHVNEACYVTYPARINVRDCAEWDTLIWMNQAYDSYMNEAYYFHTKEACHLTSAAIYAWGMSFSHEGGISLHILSHISIRHVILIWMRHITLI